MCHRRADRPVHLLFLFSRSLSYLLVCLPRPLSLLNLPLPLLILYPQASNVSSHGRFPPQLPFLRLIIGALSQFLSNRSRAKTKEEAELHRESRPQAATATALLDKTEMLDAFSSFWTLFNGEGKYRRTSREEKRDRITQKQSFQRELEPTAINSARPTSLHCGAIVGGYSSNRSAPNGCATLCTFLLMAAALKPCQVSF